MADLTKYILQALYEVTGHDGNPVDVVSTLLGRWSHLRADDVRQTALDMAARDLVTMRSDGAGHITGAGIRALSALWKEGAFGPVPPQAAPHIDRLHALAEAHAQAEATRAARASLPPSGAGAIDVHIGALRRALVGITQEISAATDLGMEEWAVALELTARVDGALDAIGGIVRR